METSTAIGLEDPLALDATAGEAARADGERHPAATLPAAGAVADGVSAVLPPEPIAGLARWRGLGGDEQKALRALAAEFGAMSVPQVLGHAPSGWLVKGLLGSCGLAVLAGSPGAGKSFLVLDLALSIVHSLEWHGLRTRTGAVLYLAAAGGAGMTKRLRAWHSYHQQPIDRPGLLVVDRAVQLVDGEATKLATLLQLYAAASGLAPRLIVVDALARCALGVDENSAKGMGELVAAAETLKRASGCCVLLVHHTGKDASRGLRGSSALNGAVDSSLLVTADEGILRLRTDKRKDDE